MLIIAILLSLVCPAVLRKYDLRKYVITFKARSQKLVKKHNATCGMCYCGLSYSYCNRNGQEDFTWQKIWRTSFSFIQGLLEWPLSELFFSDVSLWN